ncbi:MAG: VWA domain-containing protein [candidate division KSB1 bacterium]|nr:VWA domain-containing protein [candidate division KSB1 bacterium]
MLIILMVSLIGLTWFVYRYTVPPVPSWVRRLLKLLRIAALLILSFLLFEPVISLSWYKAESPIVAVLVDTSASMSLTDEGISRSARAQSIIRSELFQRVAKENHVEYYQFSHQFTPLDIEQMDSIKFDGNGTDISAALRQLKQKNVDRYLKAVVLVSDGINNLGENPASAADEFDIPIFPIGIGQPTEQRDVRIAKVTTNQITYAGTEVPVEVSVQAAGFSGQKIEIQLWIQTQVVDSKWLTIDHDLYETSVRLYFTPEQPGLQKYTIKIPALNDELTTLNNQNSFYTQVLKSKLKLLLVAGSPDPDLKFIVRNLSSDPNIQIEQWVVKKAPLFYQGDFPSDPNQLFGYDAIILLNYPVKNSSPYVLQTIKAALGARQIPLLLLAGNALDASLLLPLQDYLPVTFLSGGSEELLVMARLSMTGSSHPIARIVDDELENQQYWQNLPPIYLSAMRTKLHPGSEVILEVDPQQSLLRGNFPQPPPLIVARKLGQQKSLTFLGYGFWRWDLLMWGIGRSNETLNKLLSNSIRWLITKEDTKPVRIFPTQTIFREGQKVSFNAEVYYEDYRPRDGVEVKVFVRGGQRSFDFSLNGIGTGKYEGSLPALPAGDYSYRGTATFNNRELGTDQGNFSVEPYSQEFLQTKRNDRLLQQLALKTGGKFFTETDYDELVERLKFPVQRTLQSAEVQLWNRAIWLILAVVLLGLEWLLRKRAGML